MPIYSFFVVGLCLSIIAIVYVIAKVMNYDIQDACAMILASAFMNNGNYGTPVVLLIFGAAGLDIAVILMVLQQLAMSTIGVFFRRARKLAKRWDENGLATCCADAGRLWGATWDSTAIGPFSGSCKRDDMRKTRWRRCDSDDYDCTWDATRGYFVPPN